SVYHSYNFIDDREHYAYDDGTNDYQCDRAFPACASLSEECNVFEHTIAYHDNWQRFDYSVFTTHHNGDN
ncbi:hypothetical protein AAVH_42054, partial [Aphelenchoides avenae]